MPVPLRYSSILSTSLNQYTRYPSFFTLNVSSNILLVAWLPTFIVCVSDPCPAGSRWAPIHTTTNRNSGAVSCHLAIWLRRHRVLELLWKRHPKWIRNYHSGMSGRSGGRVPHSQFWWRVVHRDATYHQETLHKIYHIYSREGQTLSPPNVQPDPPRIFMGVHPPEEPREDKARSPERSGR